MTNAFDNLISRLNMAKEIISELEDMPIKISKIEKQSKEDCKANQTRKTGQYVQGLGDNHKKCNIHIRRRKKEKEQSNIWRNKIKADNFPQINVQHQSTNAGCSENTKQNKCQPNYTQVHHIQTAENQS